MYTHDDIVQPRDRRAWTDDEDELLRAAIDKEDSGANPPSKWHAIAKHIPNRTNKDCRKRWWAQMATRVSKGSWSSEEDERLFSAVEELGTKWAAVASRVGTRNSGQCAKRWNDALNPAIDRSGWTPEEDQHLLQAVEVQGHSWANIARTYLPGRTGLAAKNRYNHLIRGSSDRSPRASALRRRSTRGSSFSGSSTSSPRSTVTPPPSSSSGASSPGSAGTPLTPDVYCPLDSGYPSRWPGADVSLFDDIPGLVPSSSRASPSPMLHLNMFMQGAFGEYLDPAALAMDPAAFALDGSLLPEHVCSPASSLCSPTSLVPETPSLCSPTSLVDGWFPYPDFNSSTPQLGQPQYHHPHPNHNHSHDPNHDFLQDAYRHYELYDAPSYAHCQ